MLSCHSVLTFLAVLVTTSGGPSIVRTAAGAVVSTAVVSPTTKYHGGGPYCSITNKQKCAINDLPNFPTTINDDKVGGDNAMARRGSASAGNLLIR